MSRPDRSLNATVGEDGDDELQDFLPDDGPTPEELVASRHDDAVRTNHLAKALKSLTPREREIINRRFLEDDGRTTLAEIGATFGVTKERIRQIEGKALDKLRDALDDADADSRELFPR